MNPALLWVALLAICTWLVAPAGLALPAPRTEPSPAPTPASRNETLPRLCQSCLAVRTPPPPPRWVAAGCAMARLAARCACALAASAAMRRAFGARSVSFRVRRRGGAGR